MSPAQEGRVAVVGLGERGVLTAGVLSRLGALTAVSDADPQTLVDVGQAFIGSCLARLEGDYLRLLAAGDVDAVALCTPPSTWDGMAEAALRAGKDVYLDGPLVLPLSRGQALVELARERRRVLMAGPVLRFSGAFSALLAAIRTGALGRLEYVSGRHFKPTQPGPFAALDDTGPSPLLSQLVLEVLDMVGARPQRILTRATGWRTARVPDVTETLLECHAGPKVFLHTSHVHPTQALELSILGSEGSAQLSRDDHDRLHLTLHGGAIDAVPVPPHPSEPTAAREASLRHFIEAVADRRSPHQGPDAQLGLWRLLHAAQRSLDEGGPVDPAQAAAPTRTPGGWVHPTVQLDESQGPCEMGEGTKIWHFSKLLGPLKIGRACSFGQNVVIERGVTIGDNVKVQNNVSIYSGVILEDDVFCGPSMVFTNVGTPRSHYPRQGQYAVTRVGRGASIGANATVVCGHTLGQYCFVGAGAVVTRDVPDYALVYGNPARLMGFTCYCGVRLPFGTAEGECQEAACAECGRRYTRESRQVVMLADADAEATRTNSP